MAGSPLEAPWYVYGPRQRVAIVLSILTVLVLVGMVLVIFFNGIEKFENASFVVGIVAGVLGAAAIIMDLRNKARKSQVIGGSVLIRESAKAWVQWAWYFALILFSWVVSFFFGVERFLLFGLGALFSIAPALLIGIYLLENKIGKVYWVA